MAEKLLARVAVSSVPFAADKLYTYRIPDELAPEAASGKRVLLQFGRGNRRSEGFVLDIVRAEDKPAYKPIDAFLDEESLLDSRDIRLARWMKARYFCTYYDALKTLLPGGVWLKSREIWKLNEEVSAEQALSAADGAELNPIDPGEGGGGGGSFTFAPNIVIQGNADADVLEEALRRAKEEFEAWYEQMMRKRARTAY